MVNKKTKINPWLIIIAISFLVFLLIRMQTDSLTIIEAAEPQEKTYAVTIEGNKLKIEDGDGDLIYEAAVSATTIALIKESPKVFQIGAKATGLKIGGKAFNLFFRIMMITELLDGADLDALNIDELPWLSVEDKETLKELQKQLFPENESANERLWISLNILKAKRDAIMGAQSFEGQTTEEFWLEMSSHQYHGIKYYWNQVMGGYLFGSATKTPPPKEEFFNIFDWLKDKDRVDVVWEFTKGDLYYAKEFREAWKSVYGKRDELLKKAVEERNANIEKILTDFAEKAIKDQIEYKWKETQYWLDRFLTEITDYNIAKADLEASIKEMTYQEIYDILIRNSRGLGADFIREITKFNKDQVENARKNGQFTKAKQAEIWQEILKKIFDKGGSWNADGTWRPLNLTDKERLIFENYQNHKLNEETLAYTDQQLKKHLEISDNLFRRYEDTVLGNIVDIPPDYEALQSKNIGKKAIKDLEKLGIDSVILTNYYRMKATGDIPTLKSKTLTPKQIEREKKLGKNIGDMRKRLWEDDESPFGIPRSNIIPSIKQPAQPQYQNEENIVNSPN